MANDVFAGTAEYYARYRVDYPPALYDLARAGDALPDAHTTGLPRVPSM